MSLAQTLTFDRCIEVVLELEGPMTDDPHDPGGLTKFGISQRNNPDINVRNLTRDGAKAVYFRRYWLPARCDGLKAPIALCVFDSAVNQGICPATKLLQEACGAEVDGYLGSKTLQAVEGMDMVILIRKFSACREQAYRGEKNFGIYGNGWLARVEKIRSIALSWINDVPEKSPPETKEGSAA